MSIETYLSTTILKANGFNAPIKRQVEAEWIRKPRPFHMIYMRDSLQIKRHTQKVKGQKSYFMKMEANKETKAGVAIPIYTRQNRL